MGRTEINQLELLQWYFGAEVEQRVLEMVLLKEAPRL